MNHAREKAYKDKIREWQLVKNLKKHQIIYMLKVARKRRAEEGKDTTFFYRGNRVPEEKLRRYSRTMSTSSTIRCKTRYPFLKKYPFLMATANCFSKLSRLV